MLIEPHALGASEELVIEQLPDSEQTHCQSQAKQVLSVSV